VDPEIRKERLAALAAAEQALATEKRRIVEERRALGGEVVADHEFVEEDGGRSRLSEAFGDRKDLLVIHNMGRRCVWCTLWADGFQGLLPHILDRTALLLVSPDSPTVQREFAASRGWTFAMASAEGSSFTRNLGYETGEGMAIPGVSALRMEEGIITRVAHTQFGPGDDFCSVWPFFDLLAEGPGDWQPRFNYGCES
jgi:predicted dithiol-disulfide oxidoreductase (DUF899 family)